MIDAYEIRSDVEKVTGDQLFAVFPSARTRGALKARGKFKIEKKCCLQSLS